MLATKKPRSSIRMLDRWAISILMEAGAIQECEEHGWKTDRADPHARQRAFESARLVRLAYRRTQPPERLQKHWIRSVTSVRSARLGEPAFHSRARGAPGMPCPRCNSSDAGEEPRMPEGFETSYDKNGWRHFVCQLPLKRFSTPLAAVADLLDHLLHCGFCAAGFFRFIIPLRNPDRSPRVRGPSCGRAR